jgi:hypothetical protein
MLVKNAAAGQECPAYWIDPRKARQAKRKKVIRKKEAGH